MNKLNTKIAFALRTPNEVEQTKLLVKEMAKDGINLSQIQEATGCSYGVVKKLAEELGVEITNGRKGKTFTDKEIKEMRSKYMALIGAGEKSTAAMAAVGCTGSMATKWNKERREGKE